MNKMQFFRTLFTFLLLMAVVFLSMTAFNYAYLLTQTAVFIGIIAILTAIIILFCFRFTKHESEIDSAWEEKEKVWDKVFKLQDKNAKLKKKVKKLTSKPKK